MNKPITVLGTMTFLVSAFVASAFGAETQQSTQQAALDQVQQVQSSCERLAGEGCFWMENESGNSCWVHAGWAVTKEDCFDQDSCDGGMGMSGGGCYKWAGCSDCERQAWTDESEQQQQQQQQATQQQVMQEQGAQQQSAQQQLTQQPVAQQPAAAAQTATQQQTPVQQAAQQQPMDQSPQQATQQTDQQAQQQGQTSPQGQQD